MLAILIKNNNKLNKKKKITEILKIDLFIKFYLKYFYINLYLIN